MVIRDISKAKAELSKLLALVEKGKVVLISRAGKPIARLVPYGGSGRTRNAGSLKGKIKIAKDFEFSGKELQELFGIE